jgi:2'-5' RNA ligase
VSALGKTVKMTDSAPARRRSSALPSPTLSLEKEITQRRHMHSERLFAAITLSEDVKAGLAGMQTFFPGLKWTAPDNLHLTLCFIGQAPRECVDAVRQSLRAVRSEAFCLLVVGLGLFQRGNGGILWAGLREEPALAKLKRQVDAALRSDAGMKLEETRFAPHLTLSRLRELPSRDLKSLVQSKSAEGFGEVSVTAFTLFRSFLRPTGAVHEPVETYPLEEGS